MQFIKIIKNPNRHLHLKHVSMSKYCLKLILCYKTILKALFLLKIKQILSNTAEEKQTFICIKNNVMKNDMLIFVIN